MGFEEFAKTPKSTKISFLFSNCKKLVPAGKQSNPQLR